MNIKTDYSRRAGAEQAPTDQPINLPPGDIGPTDSDFGYSEALVRRILIADRAAQSEARSPALLFAHDDGRHAVAHAGAAFLQGDPAWHRVGPVEVHGAQSPQGAPVAYLHPITHPNWLDVCEPGSPGAFPVFAAPQGGEAAQASTASDLTDAIMHAVTSCSHSIDREQIVLRFDAKNPGHNALNQLHRRIGAALAQAGAPGRSEHAGPVAWQCRKPRQDGWGPATTENIANKLKAEGYAVRALYAAPQPLLHGAPESAQVTPDGWCIRCGCGNDSLGYAHGDSCQVASIPCRSPESARQPLTEAKIRKCWESTFSTGNPYCPCDLHAFTKTARAIERAHGINSASAMKAAGARE